MQLNAAWWKSPNLGLQDNWPCQIDRTGEQGLALAGNLRLLEYDGVDGLGRASMRDEGPAATTAVREPLRMCKDLKRLHTTDPAVCDFPTRLPSIRIDVDMAGVFPCSCCLSAALSRWRHEMSTFNFPGSYAFGQIWKHRRPYHGRTRALSKTCPIRRREPLSESCPPSSTTSRKLPLHFATNPHHVSAASIVVSGHY